MKILQIWNNCQNEMLETKNIEWFWQVTWVKKYRPKKNVLASYKFLKNTKAHIKRGASQAKQNYNFKLASATREILNGNVMWLSLRK